jgi:hypothetical protein
MPSRDIIAILFVQGSSDSRRSCVKNNQREVYLEQVFQVFFLSRFLNRRLKINVNRQKTLNCLVNTVNTLLINKFNTN